MILALGACLSLAAPAVAEAASEPRVSIVIVPRGTTPSVIASESAALSVGTMSAGLGVVPVNQTYLDIGQGNRLFSSLYPERIPPLEIGSDGVKPGDWRRVLQRAEGAPAQLIPGLLASELRAAGIEAGARREVGGAALIVADEEGSIDRARGCRIGECPGVTVARADSSELDAIASRLTGDDMLVVLERPPPIGRLLAIGIAGRGFEGNLASPTTRLDGYVLSTDLAPTILERYGLSVPDEVSGRAITSVPGTEASAVASLQARLSEVGPRRHPVLGVNVIAWVGLTLLAAVAFRQRGAALALTMLAVTVAWVPGLLLLTAALEPSELAERLIVGVGGPILAFGALWALRPRFGEVAGYAAFALGAIVSIGGTAVDMIAGSPLTALSLVGSNPEIGVRFFGIGNELEAVIGTLLALGSGAAVTAMRPEDPRRAVAVVAAAATLVAVVIFAPGRWGADVGAAITFPAGAAGVVIAALGGTRRRLLAVAAVPVLAVCALLAVDLAIGGDAHLSRSVLDAGGLEELGQVVERRVRLGARSFGRFFDSFFFAAALLGIVVAIFARHRILGWFDGRPAARAGFIGGAAAAVVGSLANDSGALLLMVGTAYLTAFAGLAWAVPHLGRGE